MKYLIIILLGILMSFSNCATKRKTKLVEKVGITTENTLNNDSVIQSVVKVEEKSFNQAYKEFENVLKALNIEYDGEQDNNLKVVLSHTEEGMELNISGKGKTYYNEQSEQLKYLTRYDVISSSDSLKSVEVLQNKQEKTQKLIDSFKANTDKKKIDFSFWIYSIMGTVLAVGTVLYITIKKIKGGK